MTNEKLQLIRRIYGILLSLFAVTIGILLIVFCLQIYRSGERPFTRETVGEALSILRIPSLFFIAFMIGRLFIPRGQKALKKVKGTPDEEEAIRRMTSRIDSFPVSIADKIYREKRLRELLFCINLLLLLVATAFALAYTLNTANFPGRDANAEILKGALVTFAAYALPLAYAVVISFVNKASRKREYELLKNAFATKYRSLADEDEESVSAKETPLFSLRALCKGLIAKWNRYCAPFAKYAVLLLAALFIILGIVNGGADNVLQKAIRICTECIGLG